MKLNIAQTVSFFTMVVLVCCIIYGGYWLGKTISYSIFYEDMVKKTVTDMVRPEALR